MAMATLRYCWLMTAFVALTVDGRVFAAPGTAPFNRFGRAPIHSHNSRVLLVEQQAHPPVSRRPTTTVLPLHPSPYPLFHTLPYPLPRPLLCPPLLGFPPYAVDEHGRLPQHALSQTQGTYRAPALYQNIFSQIPSAPAPFGWQPLPFYPTPYTYLCRPFPFPFFPFPLPHAGAPLPR